MAEKFSLAELLADVSELDTGVGKEQIEYIDIDNIKSDENNFYSLSGIDKLMASIELVGLQQPVRVRPNKEGYVIVSGHRRIEALRRLIAEGKEEFCSVPCIVERDEVSPELQELRLIFANSDTRVLSSAELQKQAARVEELLYKLKEQGVEFPGRMRDHVAEACNISRTKLARLKAIDNNLAFELKYEYNNGKLNEACAYALSQISRLDQFWIYNFLSEKKYLYESYIKAMGNNLKRMQERVCPKDICKSKCNHAVSQVKKLHANGYEGYGHCSKGCCYDCPDIASCNSVCPKMADEVQIAKQELKAQRIKDKEAQAARDAEPIRNLTALWARFAEARKSANIDTKDVYFIMSDGISLLPDQIEKREAFEVGKGIRAGGESPFGYPVPVSAINRLIAAASAMGCSIDYLLCRTNDPRVSGSDTGWRTAKPQVSGEYIAKFDVGGQIFKKIAYYDILTDRFLFSKDGSAILADLIAWYPMPEDI